MNASAIPFEEQIRCVERELKYRRRVYARRVEQGLMTRDEADYQIDCMEAVLATVKERAPQQATLL